MFFSHTDSQQSPLYLKSYMYFAMHIRNKPLTTFYKNTAKNSVGNYIVAYLLYARPVEPQRPRGTRATGELRIVLACY
jgi:hypothetical protein